MMLIHHRRTDTILKNKHNKVKHISAYDSKNADFTEKRAGISTKSSFLRMLPGKNSASDGILCA